MRIAASNCQSFKKLSFKKFLAEKDLSFFVLSMVDNVKLVQSQIRFGSTERPGPVSGWAKSLTQQSLCLTTTLVFYPLGSSWMN